MKIIVKPKSKLKRPDSEKSIKKLNDFINNYAKTQEFRNDLHDALSVLENIVIRELKKEMTEDIPDATISDIY